MKTSITGKDDAALNYAAWCGILAWGKLPLPPRRWHHGRTYRAAAFHIWHHDVAFLNEHFIVIVNALHLVQSIAFYRSLTAPRFPPALCLAAGGRRRNSAFCARRLSVSRQRAFARL